jgi:hypothetical protein
LLTSIICAGVVGCAATNTVASPDLSSDFGTLNGATLELTAVGGFAGIQVHQMVKHDDRTYVATTRSICAGACRPPIDSVSGTFSPAAADSLFNIAWQQSPFSLKDDYGPTKGGADMMTYTLKVTFDARTKSITADDGTMPAQMRAIVGAMRGTITAASGR